MPRTTRADWFGIARRVLVERGHESLTIDELTTRAGVTKGSFYHHFRGHAGFVEAFLADVRHRAFADVVADVDPQAEPRDQARQLVEAISRHSPALERAIRRWAVTNSAAAQLVDAVDRDRYAYVEDLFTRLTDDAQHAAFLTRLHFALYLGSLQIDPPITGEEYVAMSRALERLVPAATERSA